MNSLVLLTLAGLSAAHNVVTHFHINGVPTQSCVRQAVNTNPIIELSSDAMACNTVSKLPSQKCTVKGGDNIAFEWRVDPNIPPTQYPLKDGQPVGVTDTSHKGPCAFYAKSVSDSLSAQGPGDGWFKISEDGLDRDGVFCSTRLREANAPQPAKVPKSLKPGDYLFRAEMLTLNDAGPKSIGGEEQPQFYIGCVQVTVEGTDGSATPEVVPIPRYVNISTPGLIYDIWSSTTYSNYPMPGPKPLVAAGPADSRKKAATTSAAAQPSVVGTGTGMPTWRWRPNFGHGGWWHGGGGRLRG